MVQSTQYSTFVKVRGINNPVSIPITSPGKPKISDHLKKKWQDLLNIITKCIDIPSGLVMQISKKNISVLITNDAANNPYQPENFDHLLHGLYCETVLGTNKHLLVENALKNDLWQDNPDVKLGMISYLGYPLVWPDGEFFGTICILDSKENSYAKHFIQLMSFCKNVIEQDLLSIITAHNELHYAYQQLKQKMNELEQSYAELNVLHQEKTLLLQEINHRVKNNLQIIIGLIHLQLDNINNDTVNEKLLSISDRIYSMGIVYDILYNTNNFSRINIKSYLQAVISYLVSSYSREDLVISSKLNIDDAVLINLETAVPLGLITNEICTNSIKYAFPDRHQAVITVTLRQLDRKKFHLSVFDNGVGIPDTIDFNKRHGHGFEIIDALCKQLNGSIEIDRNDHATFNIYFSLCNKEERRWTRKEC